MISVVIVGTGNVAQNLFQAFDKVADVEIIQVLGRNENHLAFAKDKVFIRLIVHTSGASSLEVLSKCNRTGIFYPLQTFTKGKIISFDDIPMCIEAKNEKDFELLLNLGKTLSNTVIEVSSEQRKILHVAAVFVNNFTNYMYTIGADICTENNIDFKILQPLIKETAAKLDDLTPYQSQTGPAKRGDQKTLHKHLQLIKNTHQRELYTLLSNAIKEKHGKEL